MACVRRLTVLSLAIERRPEKNLSPTGRIILAYAPLFAKP
jgi:hypothetical protein